MNWSLVPSQEYGLVLFMLFLAVAALAGAIGLAWILFQFARTRRQDQDQHINDCVASHISPLEGTLRELKSLIDTRFEELEKRLPKAETISSHGERIGRLEDRTKATERDIEDVFRRLRSIENACAAAHGSSAGCPAGSETDFDEERTVER